jgi:hypothetical protein
MATETAQFVITLLLCYLGLGLQDQFDRNQTEIVAYEQTNIWGLWGWVAAF